MNIQKLPSSELLRKSSRSGLSTYLSQNPENLKSSQEFANLYKKKVENYKENDLFKQQRSSSQQMNRAPSQNNKINMGEVSIDDLNEND